ncbi:hypothetical protein [uncultured Propionivibrio sp.]|uniref:hypothetical protein n=1 Tax=uncultured Propionivibrio sp. TaxID=426737 RepID=UPI0029C0442A|nr:hypothetical protein [uncultured Propionivibrio sp.]
MNRHIRNFLFFCVGLLLGGFLVVANAETIPASTDMYTPRVYFHTALGDFATPDAFCQKMASLYSTTIVSQDWVSNPPGGIVTCHLANGQNPYNAAVYACDYGGTYNGAYLKCAGSGIAYCPTSGGWTLSGTSCTRPDCATGETRQADGSCKVVCPAAGTAIASSLGGTYSGAGASIPSSLCINGCTYSTAGLSVGTGSLWATAPGASLGSTCTGSTGAQMSTSDPAYKCVSQGKGYGTVNGVIVCTEASTVTSSGTKSSTSTSTTTDASNTTTTSTASQSDSSTTTCSGETCTTTTTTTKTNADGTKSVVTTTSNQDKAGFCQTNPTAPACSGATEQSKYCADNPTALSCQKASFTNPTTGTFESKSAKVQEAKDALNAELDTIKAQAKTLIGQLGTGQGALPCPEGVTVAGSVFKLCARDFESKLAPIPAAIMVIAAFASLVIIFR